MANVGVILASGISERFNSSIPKQYIKLNGKPCILYVLDEFLKANLFDQIIIVLNDLKYSYVFKEYNQKFIHLIKGGTTRNKSIKSALDYCFQFNPQKILFHEAVRPLIKAKDLLPYFTHLENNIGVLTIEPIIDSLYPSIDRTTLKLVQAPEAFIFKNLYDVFDANKSTTAIYEQLNNPTLFLNHLSHPNSKVTYQSDAFLIEHLLKYSIFELNNINLQNKKILLFGRNGGIGNNIYNILQKQNALIFASNHKEFDIVNDSFECGHSYDVIINASGVGYKDCDGLISTFDNIMNTNVKANLKLFQYALAMDKRPINIVLISSSSATYGRKNNTVYSASKAALHSIVESQAERLAKEQIYVNVICPEKVFTSFAQKLANQQLNEKECLTTNEVSNAVLNYCDTQEYGKIVYLKKGMFFNEK